MNTEQLQKMATAPGFIAALDQSGGSTPKALRLYGLEESTYSGEAEMFDLIHQMRTRIMTSSAFTGERILGAIIAPRMRSPVNAELVMIRVRIWWMRSNISASPE